MRMRKSQPQRALVREGKVGRIEQNHAALQTAERLQLRGRIRAPARRVRGRDESQCGAEIPGLRSLENLKRRYCKVRGQAYGVLVSAVAFRQHRIKRVARGEVLD